MFAARVQPGAHDGIDGLEFLDKVVDIDQSPYRPHAALQPGHLHRRLRARSANGTQACPRPRCAATSRGASPSTSRAGRCEACQGDGLIKIEMHFLPDIYVQCEECKGRRYNRETLEILYRGQSIADVLAMTVDDASAFFKAVPAIRNKLETLQRVGLGYIQVGQQATTLSGGEAQRVKLAKELSRRATGKTLYILDEPTTGLHFHDVRKLLEVLHALVESGNTVVVIEHNLEVIKTADWIVDLGPEGGDGGGRVVASGTPGEVAEVDESYTGQFLRRALGPGAGPARRIAGARQPPSRPTQGGLTRRSGRGALQGVDQTESASSAAVSPAARQRGRSRAGAGRSSSGRCARCAAPRRT